MSMAERDEEGRFAWKERAEKRGATGRPSTYRARYAAAAAILARNGASDAQLADFFGVPQSTIHRWKIRYPSFRKAIEDGNEALTPWVERSLAHRAMGYTHDSEKIFYNSAEDKVVRVPTREHYPPDVAAAKHWLERKGGPEWAPQPLRVDHRVMVAQMTDEELARALLQANEILALADESGEK